MAPADDAVPRVLPPPLLPDVDVDQRLLETPITDFFKFTGIAVPASELLPDDTPDEEVMTSQKMRAKDVAGLFTGGAYVSTDPDMPHGTPVCVRGDGTKPTDYEYVEPDMSGFIQTFYKDKTTGDLCIKWLGLLEDAERFFRGKAGGLSIADAIFADQDPSAEGGVRYQRRLKHLALLPEGVEPFWPKCQVISVWPWQPTRLSPEARRRFVLASADHYARKTKEEAANVIASAFTQMASGPKDAAAFSWMRSAICSRLRHAIDTAISDRMSAADPADAAPPAEGVPPSEDAEMPEAPTTQEPVPTDMEIETPAASGLDVLPGADMPEVSAADISALVTNEPPSDLGQLQANAAQLGALFRDLQETIADNEIIITEKKEGWDDPQFLESHSNIENTLPVVAAAFSKTSAALKSAEEAEAATQAAAKAEAERVIAEAAAIAAQAQREKEISDQVSTETEERMKIQSAQLTEALREAITSIDASPEEKMEESTAIIGQTLLGVMGMARSGITPAEIAARQETIILNLTRFANSNLQRRLNVAMQTKKKQADALENGINHFKNLKARRSIGKKRPIPTQKRAPIPPPSLDDVAQEQAVGAADPAPAKKVAKEPTTAPSPSAGTGLSDFDSLAARRRMLGF